MGDTDLPKPETANPEAPSNTTVTTTTPVTTGNAVDQAEVERLRKEAEQARMRANQLEKEAEARRKADEEKVAKELEEQNQYKQLYEQATAKLEEVETEIQKKERESELSQARTEALKDYPDEVKAQAKELGIDLVSAEESAVADFKKKLDTLNKVAEGSGTVTPNNPKPPSTKQVDLSTDELREGLQDENSFHDIVTKRFPGIAAMTNKREQQPPS